MARGVNAERVKIDQRREEVGRLYLQRYTQTQIAEKMGVAQSTISEDIAALRAQWKANSVEDFDGVKLREAAELDEMETAAAQLFDRHKQVEWFVQRLKVKERRAKLLGLDAPTKTDSNVNFRDLSDDELVAQTKAAFAGDGPQGPDLSDDTELAE